MCLVSIGFAQYTMEDRIYDYIDDYKDLAMQEMELYGVPASITLAQAIYASQAGTNDLVRECHNHFAIMCHTQEWTGETYYRPADKKQENCYRKYATDADSYRDHSLFLSTRSRYVKLFYYPITDYRSWATGLLEAGFSGNPKYADTLINKKKKYYLMHYDTGGNSYRNCPRSETGRNKTACGTAENGNGPTESGNFTDKNGNSPTKD